MKHRWAVALAAVGALLASGLIATPAYADSTETEANNSMATATVIAPNATVSGSTHSSSYSDSDFYAVDLPSAGRVRLNLTFPSDLGTGKAYEVHVYDSTGDQLYSFTVEGGDWNGSGLAAQGVFLRAGRAYVQVYGHKDYRSWGETYSLNVGWAAGRVELEPNASTSAATPLVLGATVSGSALNDSYSDSDFYAVTLAQASAVSLAFAFPSGLGSGSTYTLSVYDPNGTTIDEFYLSGADYSKGFGVSLPAGRNYVRVYGHEDYATWGKVYTLSVGYSWTSAPTPVITGTAKVGSVLTANTGTWSPTPTSLGYQWYRSGKAISGATKRTWTLTAADLGATITVAVKGVRSGYPSVAKTSAGTARVIAGTLTTATPTIAGPAKVGAALTAVSGSWGPRPVTMAYQWYRSGKAIAGATKAKYVPTLTDKGKKLTVKVTGTKAGYTAVALTSGSTKKVASGTLVAPVPAIRGTAKVGTTLTAVSGSWGPSPVKVTYRWYRSGKAIKKATKPSYTLTKSDKGKKITVKVTGTKAGYTKAVRGSVPTGKVVA